MLDQLFSYLKKPELYTQSTCNFWDDEHISKGLLEAHLDPDLEASSRTHEFMDKSVEWISEVVPSTNYKKLLDLGCGPGLYDERFFKKGYKITGIDFSKRSIEYAKKKAREKGKDINYIYKNYLEIDYKDKFDLVTLIYCDYVVLSKENRETLLRKIYDSMVEGGKFIFDVFTVNEFKDREEKNTWYVSNGGFFKPDKHICLESHFIYDDDIRLDQYVIIDRDEKIDVIRNWFKAYTRESIIEEIKKVGFNEFEIYSDVTGKPYDKESKTLCIIAKK